LLRKLPPLNALRSFEAAGRHLSFTKASSELFVTETAVSKAVRNLEDHFGVKLFLRENTGLQLTEYGTFMLPKVSRALDDLSISAQRVYQARNKTITILSTPYFASNFIAPLLSEMSVLEPELNITIRTSFRNEQISNADFDLAIWYGNVVREGFLREPLCSLPRAPLCSPGYAEKLGLWDAPQALKNAYLLHEFDYSTWETWCHQANVKNINVARGVVTDQFETTLGAARASAGVGLLFTALAQDPAMGLIAPFGCEETIQTEYWLYRRRAPRDQILENKIITFLKNRIDLVDGQSRLNRMC